MRKRILLAALSLIYIFALSSIPAFAQKCELTLEQAPELRGFKLAMTTGQVRARLSSATIPKANDLGIQTLSLSAVELRKSSPAASEGVKRGELTFLDGKLMRMKVVYDDSVEWSNVDEFAFSVSQSLGLPPVWPHKKDPYGYGDLDDYRFSSRNLTCIGFSVNVNLRRSRGREAALELTDARLPELVKERQREQEERKKAGFKP